ncbi:MAG: MFS transporter [Candidatus Heimdallarchaeota archaeon]
MTELKKYSKFTTLIILLAAFIAWMHDGYSLVMVTLLAPELKTFFGVGDWQIGLVFSFQFVFTVPGAILFGELGDRFGRKNALIISIAWDAIFSSLTSLVPSNMFVLFAIMRMISGLGVSWGISFSLISEHFSPKRRGAAGGLVHSTFVLGYIGAIITTLLIRPWQFCFLTALFPIPFIILFWFTLPESAIWTEYEQLRKEKQIKQKIRLKEIFSRKWRKLTVLLIFLFWFAEIAYHSLVDFAPTFFQYLFANAGVTNYESISRLFMLVLMVIAAFGLFFFGFLSDYLGRKKAFLIDNIIGIIGGVLFAIFTKMLFSDNLILLSSVFITLGFGLHGIFGVWSSELYDTEVRASANSIIFSIARGAGLGGFIVGVISDALNPFSADPFSNPFVSLQALGTGMLLSLVAFIGVFIVLNFVPEPKDKTITALSKGAILKP